jgi:SAM-dependent methyltransferase
MFAGPDAFQAMNTGDFKVAVPQRALRALSLLIVFSVGLPAGWVEGAEKPYKPVVGQGGKDVIWVPTPPALLERMLDAARVTPKDYVIDLGSGDGRNVIAAAKRGARALGIEYNPQLVALSKLNAAKQGVAERARFVQGDMFEADISRATVLPLFLLPDNLRRLTPKFLELAPGARIVTNGYEIPGWPPDRTIRVERDCGSWCTAYLYVVPARVAGAWQLPQGTLTLEQHFQVIRGWLEAGGDMSLVHGRLDGGRIRFTAGAREYSGRVQGNAIVGRVSGEASGTFSAKRIEPRE